MDPPPPNGHSLFLLDYVGNLDLSSRQLLQQWLRSRADIPDTAGYMSERLLNTTILGGCGMQICNLMSAKMIGCISSIRVVWEEETSPLGPVPNAVGRGR
ncbi:hypothetical protein PABG_03307 [Paracoccidioides brasiliensis Pb03]|nr:hypothetical protein PABG_03307 [Paracoccidioides brasiliensis Pb03]